MRVSFCVLTFLVVLCVSICDSYLMHKSRYPRPVLVKWSYHKAKHGLRYSRSQELERLEIFNRNLRYIENFNELNKHVTLKMNKFGHVSDEEFAKYYLGNMASIDRKSAIPPTHEKVVEEGEDRIVKKVGEPNIPSMPSIPSIPKLANLVKTKKIGKIGDIKPRDWRKDGIVNPIRNQGRCGSCWAFSAVGALESAWELKHNQLVELSEQELVDCSSKYGNHGCMGGSMDYAFKFVHEHGIASRNDYKYNAMDGVCKEKQYKAVAKLTSWKIIEFENETMLSEAISYITPVSVAIDASDPAFRFYSRGVFRSDDCSKTNLNHAVLAVGVADDHYIIRNSWGEEWGDRGYIHMSRNNDNNCGIASAAMYPIV